MRGRHSIVNKGLDLLGISHPLSPFSLWAFRYLSATYEQYRCLLDGSASREVDSFLKSDQELFAFGKVREAAVQ